eukprot:scaffold25052_cov110-Isochrysis_galbana.AAC.2
MRPSRPGLRPAESATTVFPPASSSVSSASSSLRLAAASCPPRSLSSCGRSATSSRWALTRGLLSGENCGRRNKRLSACGTHRASSNSSSPRGCAGTCSAPRPARARRIRGVAPTIHNTGPRPVFLLLAVDPASPADHRLRSAQRSAPLNQTI